jgi:environmental stress-induced protein Ves
VLWRISVADITAASVFSQFEGMDRTAVMLRGGSLQLSNHQVQMNFAGTGSQIQFPGEWLLQCSEPECPTQLFNIMVRRGQACADVELLENQAHCLTPGGAQVALVLRGCYRLRSDSGASHTLQARQGVHSQAVAETWRAELLEEDGAMVCCTLR